MGGFYLTVLEYSKSLQASKDAPVVLDRFKFGGSPFSGLKTFWERLFNSFLSKHSHNFSFNAEPVVFKGVCRLPSHVDVKDDE